MASSPIFTDTSAWYAYIDKSDADHAAAVKLVKNLDRPLITSNYIFDEILTQLSFLTIISFNTENLLSFQSKRFSIFQLFSAHSLVFTVLLIRVICAP